MPLPPFDRRPPRRILLVCTQRIGDVLLATPLARSLKQAWPQAELRFLVFQGTAGVLAGNPDIDRIIAYPQRTGWRGTLAQLRELWQRYDLALGTRPRTGRACMAGSAPASGSASSTNGKPARRCCWTAGRPSTTCMPSTP